MVCCFREDINKGEKISGKKHAFVGMPLGLCGWRTNKTNQVNFNPFDSLVGLSQGKASYQRWRAAFERLLTTAKKTMACSFREATNKGKIPTMVCCFREATNNGKKNFFFQRICITLFGVPYLSFIHYLKFFL
jgi:hypothetical protein